MIKESCEDRSICKSDYIPKTTQVLRTVKNVRSLIFIDIFGEDNVLSLIDIYLDLNIAVVKSSSAVSAAGAFQSLVK